MKVLFLNEELNSPEVSIVLLDWSCRESYHILYYLSKQTVPRTSYEIIWIEYYSKIAENIKRSLEICKKEGRPPVVDQWIVMEMPEEVYYHKHLMYNIGIVASRGKIVVVCDSDTMVRETFVETIIREFEKDPNIVLHLDEVRNVNKKFYPFNYPSIDDVLGEGCINWDNGKTTGIRDTEDPLHTRNYGACMCALREDLIKIGGADEHIDYLGHICGPYDMTFRLINAGKKEIWHETEYLYHTWHPGTDGKGNYCGPHDGKNMSTTALSALANGRILPLVENEVIKRLRTKGGVKFLYRNLLEQMIPYRQLPDWRYDRLGQKEQELLKIFYKHPAMLPSFIRFLARYFHLKFTRATRSSRSAKELFRKALRVFNFVYNVKNYYVYLESRCENCIDKLIADGVKSCALYGTGDAAELFYKLSEFKKLKIDGVYDRFSNGSFYDHRVLPLEELKDYDGMVVLTSIVDINNQLKELTSAGVERERIITL